MIESRTHIPSEAARFIREQILSKTPLFVPSYLEGYEKGEVFRLRNNEIKGYKCEFEKDKNLKFVSLVTELSSADGIYEVLSVGACKTYFGSKNTPNDNQIGYPTEFPFMVIKRRYIGHFGIAMLMPLK